MGYCKRHKWLVFLCSVGNSGKLRWSPEPGYYNSVSRGGGSKLCREDDGCKTDLKNLRERRWTGMTGRPFSKNLRKFLEHVSRLLAQVFFWDKLLAPNRTQHYSAKQNCMLENNCQVWLVHFWLASAIFSCTLSGVLVTITIYICIVRLYSAVQGRLSVCKLA